MFLFVALILGALVLCMIFFNVYFRYQLMQDYKYLVKHRVEFGVSHILSQKKMESEIISRYPDHADNIRSFSSKIARSFKIALLLICVISIVGIYLWYTR